ncbi:MAG: replication-relaxation family protein [Candidatus Omnitrophica bacterium]|nr:replication-relaxation family protein [Candidatus Omnitrophota bacterium]
MDTTLSTGKHKQPNRKHVQTGARDRLLIKTIWEQKFLTRTHVKEHIFDDCQSYGKIRIRKLKKFGYLKAIETLAGEPESYLLGPLGVEELRKSYPAGIRGWGCADVQDDIEIAAYKHDKMVTNVRFLFQDLKLCTDWKSEKILKAGVRGERKTPDGFFTRNGKGIAIELERRDKKPTTYRKIIEGYENDPKTHYVFYVCERLEDMQLIMKIATKAGSKKLCFVLYKNLMELREEVQIWTCKGHFKLKDIL